MIVARECLVDGEVKSESLSDFFAKRAAYISSAYPGFTEADYYGETVSEMEKIMKIPDGAHVYLWFEDDLFCQVNFWFVVALLSQHVRGCKLYLVRPMTSLYYGFGGLDQAGLWEAYGQSAEIKEVDQVAALWKAYQREDHEALMQGARKLEATFPFVLPAVEAYFDSIPSKDDLGRPKKTLLAIMEELETVAFGPVFQEFHKRESIYGYGDLQVKRLFDELRA